MGVIHNACDKCSKNERLVQGLEQENDDLRTQLAEVEIRLDKAIKATLEYRKLVIKLDKIITYILPKKEG